MADAPEKPAKGLSAKDDPEKKWKPGQSGNPAGRPLGARVKLSETFLKDLLEDWEQHGKTALAEARTKKPDVYLRVVASVLPKQLDVRRGAFEGLTDEQLFAKLESSVGTDLARRLVGVAGGSGEAAGPEEGSRVRH